MASLRRFSFFVHHWWRDSGMDLSSLTHSSQFVFESLHPRPSKKLKPLLAPDSRTGLEVFAGPLWFCTSCNTRRMSTELLGLDQEVVPDDIQKQWQEARANRSMQFKVGDVILGLSLRLRSYKSRCSFQWPVLGWLYSPTLAITLQQHLETPKCLQKEKSGFLPTDSDPTAWSIWHTSQNQLWQLRPPAPPLEFPGEQAMLTNMYDQHVCPGSRVHSHVSEKEAETSRWWYYYSVTVHTVYTALGFDCFLLKTLWEPGIVDCRESLSLFHLSLDWSGTGGFCCLLFGGWFVLSSSSLTFPFAPVV